MLLSFCMAILLIGTVRFLYLYYHDRRRIFFAISLLSMAGCIFILSDLMVIFLSLVNKPAPAMHFHRIEALMAVTYIFSLPFFLDSALKLNETLIRVNKWIYRSAFFLVMIILLTAFVIPESFIGFYKTGDILVTPWNRGRGTPGILYRIRDIAIIVIAFYSIVLYCIEIIKYRLDQFIMLLLGGSLFAVIAGVIDVMLAFKEMETGLFSIRIYSIFGPGMAVFICAGMFGILQIRQRHEEEMALSNKLKSIGVLAGGIAHDFNNLLTGILGNATLLLEYDSMVPEHRELVNEIYKASSRARGLSSQLLTFSQGGIPVPKETSLAILVRDVTEFSLRGSNVRAKYDFENNLNDAYIDEDQMGQVIQNIVINSKEAMENGGTIEISAKNNKLLHDRERKYVTLTIQDDGPGIKEQNLCRIFEPYYTTKERGSGLGLAVSWSIVENHGGKIDVESFPGQGTKFVIHIPATQKVDDLKRDVPLPDYLPDIKILFMDDEVTIKSLVRAMFKKMNVESVIVDNGESAVEEYRKAMENNDAFDLLILDLTVPGGMGGKQVLETIKTFDPGVRAVLTSGYMDEHFLKEVEEAGFIDFIPKPFSYFDLQKIIVKFITNHYSAREIF